MTRTSPAPPSQQTYLTCSLFIGEGGPSAGVDLMTAQGAPAGERGRIDYGANDADAGADSLALGLARAFLPCVMGAGEVGRIDHDPQNFRVILSVVPGDADDPDRAKGGCLA